MKSSGDTRKIAVSLFLNLWFVSGMLLCCSCCFIGRDEDRLKLGLKKIAQSAANDLVGGDRVVQTKREIEKDAIRSSLGSA